jgi:transcriptional regulator with XRE-family HTH domain
MRVRNRVREVRQGLRFSQRLLARQTGVSPLILRRIEADDGYEPRLGIVRRISEVLERTDLFWIEAGETSTGESVSA